MVNYMF